MRIYLIPTVCLVLSTLSVTLLLSMEPSMIEQTAFDYMRLIVPTLLFMLLILAYVRKNKMKTAFLILLSISLPFFVVAVNWLAIYTFTDYRKSRAPIFLSLSMFYLVFYYSVLVLGHKKKCV